MATKSQLQATIDAKDTVIRQQSNQIDDMEQQIAARDADKNDNFIQVYRDPGIPYLMMGLLNPAGRVYFTLAALANNQNMIMISSAALGEILDLDPRNVRSNIRKLKAMGCLEIAKQGNNNIYILNPDITWAAGKTQRRYCKFEGTAILSTQDRQRLEEASERLAAKRRELFKPNTV